MKKAFLMALAGLALLGQSTTRPILLNWQVSTTPGVTGYNVYRASATGGPYTKLALASGLTFTDPAVTIGTGAFYVVTAVAPACTVPPTGVCGESAFSNEAGLASVPAKPNAPGQIIIVIP